MNCERRLLANITPDQVIDLMSEKSTEKCLECLVSKNYIELFVYYFPCIELFLRTYYSYFKIYTTQFRSLK